KGRNVLWAIRLVSQFTAPGDVEWANLVSAIFAEARALNLPIERDDQLYLCEHLLSVTAADPLAADAYHHLQATYPQVVTREYAWLACRAAQQPARWERRCSSCRRETPAPTIGWGGSVITRATMHRRCRFCRAGARPIPRTPCRWFARRCCTNSRVMRRGVRRKFARLLAWRK